MNCNLNVLEQSSWIVALDASEQVDITIGDELSKRATKLMDDFESTGNLADLNETTSLYRQALGLFPAKYPHRITALNNRASDLTDLEDSIEFYRQVLDLSLVLDLDQATLLDNLVTALHKRFEQKGDLIDLE